MAGAAPSAVDHRHRRPRAGRDQRSGHGTAGDQPCRAPRPSPCGCRRRPAAGPPPPTIRWRSAGSAPSTCGIAPAKRCCAIRPPASSSVRPSRQARASSAIARSRRRSGQNVRRLSSSRSSWTIPAGGWRREITHPARSGSRWTDRRWHTVSIPLPDTSAAAIDATVTLSTKVAGRLRRGTRVGALRRAAFRVAAAGARRSSARWRRSRGACGPMASASRSSCCGSPASPAMTHTRAG